MAASSVANNSSNSNNTYNHIINRRWFYHNSFRLAESVSKLVVVEKTTKASGSLEGVLPAQA